jgi:hypothetical protein
LITARGSFSHSRASNGSAVGHTIRGRVIVYTACGAVAIVYAASLAILDVEGDNPDSKIKTLDDACVLDCGKRRRRRHR